MLGLKMLYFFHFVTIFSRNYYSLKNIKGGSDTFLGAADAPQPFWKVSEILMKTNLTISVSIHLCFIDSFQKINIPQTMSVFNKNLGQANLHLS